MPNYEEILEWTIIETTFINLDVPLSQAEQKQVGPGFLQKKSLVHRGQLEPKKIDQGQMKVSTTWVWILNE